MKKLLIFALNTFYVLAHAHGENALGPHRGYIRMPGAYHTELVPIEDSLFKVYLMDVNNKIPLTKNSSVIFEYISGATTVYECKSSDDHFSCRTNKKIDLKKGKIILKTSRGGSQGKEAVYELPLKLDSAMRI